MRLLEQHEPCGGLDSMGEKQNQPLQLSFNPSVGKEMCCKSDGISGNFGSVGSDLRPLGADRMKKLFHTVGEQRDGCTMNAVFEPKRRFRNENSSHSSELHSDSLSDPACCRRQRRQSSDTKR